MSRRSSDTSRRATSYDLKCKDSSVAEVSAREQRYLDEKGSLGEAATEPEESADAK